MSRPLPAATAGGITFVCMNHPLKTSPQCVRALGAHPGGGAGVTPDAAGNALRRPARASAGILRRRGHRGRAHRAGRRGSDRDLSRPIPARRHRARQPAMRRRHDDLRRAVDGRAGRHHGRRSAVFAQRCQPAAQRGPDRADHAHARRVCARPRSIWRPIGRRLATLRAGLRDRLRASPAARPGRLRSRDVEVPSTQMWERAVAASRA